MAALLRRRGGQGATPSGWQAIVNIVAPDLGESTKIHIHELIDVKVD
jgi:hypothetical protein